MNKYDIYSAHDICLVQSPQLPQAINQPQPAYWTLLISFNGMISKISVHG